jgi:hypothetical protein
MVKLILARILKKWAISFKTHIALKLHCVPIIPILEQTQWFLKNFIFSVTYKYCHKPTEWRQA